MRSRGWRYGLVLLGAGLLFAAVMLKTNMRDTENGGPTPMVVPTEIVHISAEPTATASPLDRNALAKAIAKAAGTSTRVSIAVRDLTTGTTYAYGASRRFETASIVKVDILATLLLQAQHRHRALTATQKALATRMIENSDNDAANALWSAIGGTSGLTKANRTLGLTETTTTSASWGLTGTSARDQVRLLAALASDGPLTRTSRRYALGLMMHVNTTQDWGVSAAADGAAVALKNGWLPRSTDGGLWIINSIGRIKGDHDYLIAVLSDHNPSMDAGIATIEAVTKTTLAHLP